jgi:hypothetical protein
LSFSFEAPYYYLPVVKQCKSEKIQLSAIYVSSCLLTGKKVKKQFALCVRKQLFPPSTLQALKACSTTHLIAGGGTGDQLMV